MKPLCAMLETGLKYTEKEIYTKLFLDIQKWYLQQHHQYEHLLKSDMLSELGKQFGTQLWDWDNLAMKGYTENSSAKSDLFDRTEQICKLMLSVYSYGPDNTCPAKFKGTTKGNTDSWLTIKLGLPHLIELLQAQLQKHVDGENINLATFTEEKNVRNNLTHQGKPSVCVSAIRCYNILRDMLIFMEPECNSILPRFTYPEVAICDAQWLMGRLQNLNFNTDNTMLVVGPLHDLQSDAVKVLANLPWSVVIDLDGYSSFGGLRNAVQYPHVNDQKLQLNTVEHFEAKRGFTTWFTCGDFANYTYCQPDTGTSQKDFLKKNGILFDSKASFCNNHLGLVSDMEECIKALLKQLSKAQRPLNILYIHSFDNMSELASCIMNTCENEFHRKLSVPYTVTAVYYDSPENWATIWSRLKRGYDSDDIFPLHNLFCDLDSMASTLIKFQRDLPVLVEKVEPFRLPSETGITGIGQNLAVNLSEVFDVLYEDIGGESPPKQAKEEREEFFRGGTATWSVFYEEQTVTLLDEESYKKRISNIKDVLAHIPAPDSGASKIFTILHTPGIGGSTLLRQIGWNLHWEYPVLIVKRYDSRIKSLVRSLYDMQKRGILLLADDTVDDREQLKEDIRTLDRACALVLSAREKNGGSSAEKRKGLISFSSISHSGEQTLCKRFKEYSPLSPVKLQEKDRGYDKFVRPSGMRCPFMIGLYYQEENFNGVTGYVERMMKQVKEYREWKVLSMLALCNYYGGIGMPQAFVNRYMQIPIGSSYLKKYPHAEAVLLPIRDGLSGNIDTYNPKHYLVSRELLEQCCQHLYGSTLKNSITDLSKLLIDAIFDAYQIKADDVYQNILEFLFIEKEDEEDKFSLLILDAASPSKRKEILLYLAEKFDQLTERTTPEDADKLYRMTAHFYGHLGRICHNREAGLDNPADARVYCEKAVKLMEASSQGHLDARIYHMLGESRSALFRKTLDDANHIFKESPNHFQPPQGYEAYEKEIDEICVIFEKAASYGSEEHAVSSLINLYLQYLIKVYRWKNVQSPMQLSERQMGYRTEIEHLFEWRYSREMGERSSSIFQKLEDSYRSQLSLDGSSVIEYYENRLSTLKGHSGVDSEILNVRRSLITARLSKHYAEVKENPGKYITLKSAELLSVLEQLEEVLGGQCNPYDYRQRLIRISCYDRWFYLAKMPGAKRSLEKGISYSERWIELCKQSGDNDPRPFYYFAVCSMLYALSGNAVDHSRVASCWKKSESLGADKLRDVIVKGSGMEQLLDMRYAGKNPSEYIEEANRTPMLLSGVFDHVEADRGYISLHSPNEWNRKAVKFTLGRGNTLGKLQETHKLETFGGFSYEGFRAIDQYVRDISASETSPQFKGWGSQEDVKQHTELTESTETKKYRPQVVPSKRELSYHITPLFQTRKSLKGSPIDIPMKKEALSNADSMKTAPRQDAKIKNGEKVSVLLTSIETNTAFGFFELDGATLQIKIPLKGRKIADKIQKEYRQKKRIHVLITGYSNGLYLGKI